MIVKKITTQEDMEKAFQIRKEVFVKEQGIDAELELDGYDSIADHVLVCNNNEAIATGRLRVVDGMGKLQRICVIPSYRSKGVGKLVMDGLESIAKEKGLQKCVLTAQYYAKDFYEKRGYKCTSDVFQEVGINHVIMEKKLFT